MIEDVGVDHGRLQMFMAHKFLIGEAALFLLQTDLYSVLIGTYLSVRSLRFKIVKSKYIVFLIKAMPAIFASCGVLLYSRRKHFYIVRINDTSSIYKVFLFYKKYIRKSRKTYILCRNQEFK